MDYEAVCHRLRDDVASTLLALEGPQLGATSLAAATTYHLADAIHHAAGRPNDARWRAAFSNLGRFVDVCSQSQRASRTAGYNALAAFLKENANESPTI